VSLPPELKSLHAINAEPWLQIDERPITFEGPAFDRYGSLFCSAKTDNRILKITPDKNVTNIFQQDGFLPLGLAFSENGRFYALCTSGKLFLSIPTAKAWRMRNPSICETMGDALYIYILEGAVTTAKTVLISSNIYPNLPIGLVLCLLPHE
jgi:hypothetical protein